MKKRKLLITIFLCISLIFITSCGDSKDSARNEESKKEEVKLGKTREIELSEKERNFLGKSYANLTDEERETILNIEGNYDSYINSDKKLIDRHIDRLNEEREVLEEATYGED